MERYPQLVVNIKHLKENVENMVRLCKAEGVSVTGVIKGNNGDFEMCKAYRDGGCRNLASSRVEHLKSLKEAGINTELMMIRIPMVSEVEDVVKYADVSMNSNLITLKALNEEAKKQNKTHKVILMVEMGDLREGYYDRDELIHDALFVDKELKNLYLEGVAMNVGCYGSITPTREKIQEFADVAKKVENALSRKLDIVSGGASTSMMRILDHDMPEGINNIRIGGEPMVGYTLKHVYGYPVEWEHEDVIRMRAEIVEIREKPSYPIGEISVDAFGHKPVYIDKGIRTRAIIGIGKFDYGAPEDIPNEDPTLDILGASSDHTIVDVTEHKNKLKVGDILEFRIKYGQLMYMSNSPNVHKKYIY